MGRRRARRRYQRARARKPARQPMSATTRLGFLALGLIMVAGGVALVVGGSSSPRIFRVAGILIIIGFVLVGIGLIGSR